MEPERTPWDQKMHVTTYNEKTAFLSTSYVVKWFGRFNDVRLLRGVLEATPQGTRLVEVGCATGEFYRYVRREFPAVEYVGTDISSVAVREAQRKFPRAEFRTTRKDLEGVRELAPHVVFCRDVMFHQLDPIGFLMKLAGLSSRTLVLRTRSRDKGATELDPLKSCQRYGHDWAPYIVINFDEITEAIRGNCPRCRRITALKDYEILGGTNNRYLPKECYLPETGTANLSMCLEFDDESGETEVSVKVQEEPRVVPSLLERVVARIRRELRTRKQAVRT